MYLPSCNFQKYLVLLTGGVLAAGTAYYGYRYYKKRQLKRPSDDCDLDSKD